MTQLNTKSSLFAVLLLFLYFSTSAQIKVGTNKDKPLFSIGENMSFRVTGGSGTAQYSLYYNSRDDKSIFQTGNITLNGGTTDIPYSAAQPGAVYCKVQSNVGTDIATALFDPFNIVPLEKEPVDFDAFWQNQKIQLSRVPIDAQLVPIATQSDGSQSFSISMATVDGRRVYGYVTIPSGTGPFPAIITLPPFGTSSTQLEELTNYGLSTQGKAISLTITVHNAPINTIDSNAYKPNDITDPAKYYNRLMILATLRCVDYLNNRTDFNGDIGITGISQGGGLALSVAGLSTQVKALALSVPAVCEHTGRRYHRASGFPYYAEQAYNLQLNGQADTAAIINAAKYHDAAYFAQRYKGPIQADFGYKDEVTFIATQYDALMAHQGSTIIFNKRDSGHDTPWIEYWQGRFAFFKKYLRGFANPINNTPSFIISAGNDQQVLGSSATLAGTISLNDISDASSAVRWDKVSGPGNVNFAQPFNRTTTATFSAAGTYILRFSAVNDYLIATEGKFVTMANYVTVKVGGAATPVCTNDTMRISLNTCNASGAGVNSVTLKNISGCDSIIITNIVYQPATVPVISQSGNILTSTLANSYRWYQSGTAILGTNSISYTATTSGNYYVETANNYGCKAVSASVTATIAPVYDCPALQKNIGDACDDGNPNTVNDRVRAGCICQGDAIVITNPIVLTCPKDITVYTSSPAFNSSNVLWNNPVATTSCAVGTVVQNCVTGDISGFKSLGKFGNSQYYVSTDKKNWESANTYCKSKGGYLTAVTSKEENDFIYGKLLNHNEAYFIGFSNKPDGAFQWVTGETAAYLAWEIGFPTYKTNTEYYVCMLGWSGGKWMNVNPSVEFQYIMEVDCGSGTSTVGAVNIAQVAGPANNSVVNIGTYKITYSAVDNCANKNTCGFNLTVATPPFGGDGSNVTALEAHHSNGKTDLQWITNIGITDGTAFLQRSYNGTNFETVKTALYSNPARALNAYAFEDFTQTDGTVYYRIVLQMGDGSIRISDTQNVRPVSYKGVFVYPNPTSGEVNVQLKSFEKQAVELVISNLLGQEVYREKIAAVQTSVKTISPVDVDLKQGFYILSIIYKNQSYRYPFTVAK